MVDNAEFDESVEAREHASKSEAVSFSSKSSSAADGTCANIDSNISGQDEEKAAADDVTLEKIISARSIVVTVVEIPRSERHGLFGSFTFVYEAQDPKDYPRNIKWIITFWIAVAAATAPMGSSIILPALPEVTKAFETSEFIANLTVALYMLSMSVFPLWWSSFSEAIGRRTVYLISFALYTVFNIIAAESTSIGMLIVFRVLSGGCSASVQAVGAGTVADIWAVKERGKAMGTFYLGPLCGPLLAPVIGGALTLRFGWRSTQWFQVVYGGVTLLGILFFLPETLKTRASRPPKPIEEGRDLESSVVLAQSASLSRVSSRRSTKSLAVTSRKWLRVAHEIFIEPLKIIRYLRFPAVALTVYYASIAFGALYFLNVSVEKTFSAAPYNFSSILVGCIYISNSLGYFVTSVLGGKWVDYIMHREASKAGRFDEKGKLIFRPEDRMRENVWVAAIVMPVSLFWYGWTADRGVPWPAPVIALFFFGSGSMLVFAAATTMLTEFMPKKASNGVALNNFVRNIFSFGGSLLAEPLIVAIGNGWLFTIVGIIALASCFVIVAMRRWGDKWRKDMDKRM